MTLVQSIPAVPPIPEGITSEGLISVLFLVILGMVGLFWALSKGYLRLGNGHEKELSIHITNLADRISHLESRIGELAKDVHGVRDGHHRFANIIGGLSLSFLKLSELNNISDKAEKDMRDAGIEPKSPV